MALSILNPVSNQAVHAATLADQLIKLNAQSLNTGVNATNDPVSSYIGNQLAGQAQVLDSVQTALSYGSNILGTAGVAVSSVTNRLNSILSTIAQSSGQDAATRAQLGAIIQQQLASIATTVNGANFNGRTLLTGELGGSPALTAKFPTNAVSARSGGNGDNANGNAAIIGAGFKSGATNGVSTITFANAVPAVGDRITIAGVTFTATAAAPTTEGQFQVGATLQETANNLAIAINNHSAPSLQLYDVFTNPANAGVVTITQIAPSANLIPIATNGNVANIVIAVQAAGVSGGIDVSGITNIAGWIGGGAISNGFQLVQQFTGNAAGPIAVAAGLTRVPPAPNGGDEVAVYSTIIAGQTFTGALFKANGDGNMFNSQLKMISADKSQSFTMNLSGAATSANFPIDAAANANITAAKFNNFLNAAVFQQTKTLKINNNSDTEGMAASFTATDFANLTMDSFTAVVDPANAANTVFTATISGVAYTQTVATTGLIPGWELDLTNINGNTLTIKLGTNGFVSGDAIQKALQNDGAGLDLRVGLSFADTINVKLPDMRANQVYLDPNGNAVNPATLLVTDDATAATTNAVILGALGKFNSVTASITNQSTIVSETSNDLGALIQTTQDASDELLKTNVLKASAAFAAALKAMQASFATFQAGSRVADAALNVIQQTAAAA